MLYSAASQTTATLTQDKTAAQVDKDRVRGDVDTGAINGFGSPVKGAKDYGVVSAINLDTGKVAWKARTPQPERGGVTTTSSGLALDGGGDGVLRIFNAMTGKVLFRFQTGAQIAGSSPVPPIEKALQKVNCCWLGRRLQATRGKDLVGMEAVFGLEPAGRDRSNLRLSRREILEIPAFSGESAAPKLAVAG
ncbi:MAG: hypothetical protein M3P41_01265 [Actinomycetota bacterium]|nr:hypothetical protein [Actinomycetota bacterium]